MLQPADPSVPVLPTGIYFQSAWYIHFWFAIYDKFSTFIFSIFWSEGL